MISDSDKKILIAQDDHTLAEWWCRLNKWKWPAALPNPEPELPIGDPPGRRIEIMNWILSVIGLEMALRVWNKDSMTDREFSDFWNSPHDPEARKRHQDYLARWRKKLDLQDKEKKP